MRSRISIRGCVRPSVRPSVRPWVRGSVSIKEKRGLGASYVGYPNLFFTYIVVVVVAVVVFHTSCIVNTLETLTGDTIAVGDGVSVDVSRTFAGTTFATATTDPICLALG